MFGQLSLSKPGAFFRRSLSASRTKRLFTVSRRKAAQGTANSALTAANARELAFVELAEDFTGLDGASAQPVNIDLSKPIASGFVPTVFFNGIRIKSITYTAGSRNIAYTVPYQTEATDTISVHYVNR